MNATILCGDALEQLATLPDSSVHCCVTSPPYWGLRDYGVNKLIWDADPDCDHQWGQAVAHRWTRHTDKRRWAHKVNGQGKEQPIEKQIDKASTVVDQGNWCVACGAWRGSLGLEPLPEMYTQHLVAIFSEVRRVLRDDGTLWLNIGDSYATGAGKVGDCPGGGEQGARWGGIFDEQSKLRPKGPATQPNRMPISGLKSKDLVGIPWRVAFALQADGWYLRSDTIWHKPDAMPESVRDRPTKAHEYLFLFSKSELYYYDYQAILEPTRFPSGGGNKRAYEVIGERNGPNANLGGSLHKIGPRDLKNKRTVWSVADDAETLRGVLAVLANDYPDVYEDLQDRMRAKGDVWSVNTRGYAGAHFATFPRELIAPCILAGCPPAGRRCDCDELIHTPIGEGESADPSLTVGRAGMSRPRRANEGTRPITRREQRSHAEQMRMSEHRLDMEQLCGSAFEHYIRTDRAGARPLPPDLLERFLANGWLSAPSPCECPEEPAGTVLDPFVGSGTTIETANGLCRNAIGIELNPDYIANHVQARLQQSTLDLA